MMIAILQPDTVCTLRIVSPQHKYERCVIFNSRFSLAFDNISLLLWLGYSQEWKDILINFYCLTYGSDIVMKGCVG